MTLWTYFFFTVTVLGVQGRWMTLRPFLDWLRRLGDTSASGILG
jgi:hypothetical protein